MKVRELHCKDKLEVIKQPHIETKNTDLNMTCFMEYNRNINNIHNAE